MRDAAAAAAMSDPDRNRHFRRRWTDVSGIPDDHHPAVVAIGSLGLALRAALNRRKRAGQGQTGASNGDPPQ